MILEFEIVKAYKLPKPKEINGMSMPSGKGGQTDDMLQKLTIDFDLFGIVSFEETKVEFNEEMLEATSVELVYRKKQDSELNRLTFYPIMKYEEFKKVFECIKTSKVQTPEEFIKECEANQSEKINYNIVN